MSDPLLVAQEVEREYRMGPELVRVLTMAGAIERAGFIEAPQIGPANSASNAWFIAGRNSWT